MWAFGAHRRGFVLCLVDGTTGVLWTGPSVTCPRCSQGPSGRMWRSRDCGRSNGGRDGYRGQEGAAVMVQAGEDGGWAREGGCPREKWVTCEPF